LQPVLDNDKKNGLAKLITLSNPRSPIAEAYRALRTNIQFSSLDRPLRTLLVTSAAPEEGKSTTLANLAVAMAETGREVILVDCDLRRPTLHELLHLDNSVGLTNVVLEDRTELPLQRTAQPHLRFLASGPLPPNPSELLSSRRMERVIALLVEQSEIVLFDSPPVNAVTDAAVLATRVDGVLLVVQAGKTKRELARRAKLQLDKVNARILGVVLNNVAADLTMYSY